MTVVDSELVRVKESGSRLNKQHYKFMLFLVEDATPYGSMHRAASPHPLNPLAPPSRRLEGIREILSLVHDLTVAEFHNTHGVCWSSQVRDGVFRDPEITVSENSLHVEA
jgi:hypothetical protein